MCFLLNPEFHLSGYIQAALISVVFLGLCGALEEDYRHYEE